MNFLIDIVLVIVLVFSAFSDIFYKKIFNFITFPAIVLGLTLNLLFNSWKGLGLSVLGLFGGLIIFAFVYITGGMGAGDLKLMGAIGALKGTPFLLLAALYSILIGGLFAFLVMARHKTLVASLKRIGRFIYTLFSPGLNLEPLKPEQSQPVPFGLAISLGTLSALIQTFLKG
jgi:prepilin peptidase CpaA